MIDDSQDGIAEEDTEDFAAFEKQALGDKPEDDGDDTAATDTDDDETGENGTGDDENAEGEEPKAKKGKSVQERIDELTASRREAERREAEREREVAELRRQLEALAPKPGGKERDPDAEPDPADYEFGEADAKYFAESTRWHARQEFLVQQQAAAREAEMQQLQSSFQERAGAAKEQYPDFDDKVTAGAARGEWPCPEIVGLGILASEVGPDVAYHLATNKDEAVAIAKMHPLEQARAFGRLEARYMASRDAKEQPKPRLSTQAPEPPPARTRGSSGRFSVDDDTSDFAAFEAKYAKRR